MSKVSVVIPTFNGGRHLPTALSSVLAQPIEDLEVVVIDDGSTDRTEEIVRSLEHRGDVCYIRQRRQGLAAARNLGVRAATGKWIAVLEPGDALAQDALADAVAAAEQTGATCCVAGAMEFGAAGIEILSAHPPHPASYDELTVLRKDFGGRAFLFRKDALLDVGLWDPSVDACADWDLSIRLVQSGARLMPIDGQIYLRRLDRTFDLSLARTRLAQIETFLRRHHKKLADLGNPEAARIYADLGLSLARRYCRDAGDLPGALRWICESLAYNFDPGKVMQSAIRGFRTALRRRSLIARTPAEATS